MKFKKILLVGVSESVFEKNFLDRIKKSADKYIAFNLKDPKLAKELSSTDCLLVHANVPVDKDFIDKMPSLTYIGKFSTAYGNIDLPYATQKGITITNIPGYSREAVAELALAVILEHIRDLERGKVQAREGNYSESSFSGITEIKNKKFGIIGLGSIGSRVAELALGFGADVSYWSRTRKRDFEKKGIKYKEIDKLVAESDFLCLHLALTPETNNFLDSERIRKIKKRAIIVSLVPNEIVDLKSLEKRLAKEDMTYIFDHTDELNPEQAKSLSKYKNCIMYPPIAYVTNEALRAKQEIFVSNIENFLKGKQTNKVN